MEEEGVLIEILSWLPTKSLLRFKCVNKQWHSLISDPQFAKIQLSRSSQYQTNHNLLFLTKTLLHSIDFNNCSKTVVTRMVKQVPTGSLSTIIIGSCNGLICLVDFYKWNIFICNPTILGFRQIPRSPYHRGLTTLHGFGYDASTDDYKLVMAYPFSADKDDESNYGEIATIFSLRTNYWRKIRIQYYSKDYFRSGTYWKGSLYWLTTALRDGVPSYKITTFDLATEELDHGAVPLPIVDDNLFKFKGIVGVADSLFVYRFNEETFCLEAWVMADGDGMVWTKLSISNKTLPRSLGLYTYIPLRFTREGKVALLMRNTDGDCCSCMYNPDAKDDAFQIYQISRKYKFMYCCIGKDYVESLISPFR